MKNIANAAKKISSAKSIVIASHINPDGDSIGSLLSLGLGLESLEKRVYMICQDRIPSKYVRLPGASRILRKTDKRADLAIAVDCSNREILGSAFKGFEKARDILEIDHHEVRRPFGNLKLIDLKAAAVGELIYLLLGALGVDITENIAQNILTSIIVETNSFRLPNVRPFTFRLCAKLMRKVPEFNKLVEMIYWSRSKESVILTGICLSRCAFLKRGRLVWSIIRKKDYDRIKGKDEDVDPVADEMRMIKTAEIIALFREKSKKELRVSLRSKGINVAAAAERCGGGGHFDVAGCSIKNYSAIIVVKDIDSACEVANDFAPEHLQIITADDEAALKKIRNAGAIFLGPYTPVPLGDYYAGPSHVLPTGGTAKFFGPLSCNDFLKASSVVGYDADSLAQDSDDVIDFASREGLTAHAEAVRARKKQ